MAQTSTLTSNAVSALQLEAIRHQLSDVADRMTDDQILCLADSLHDQLRSRRLVRAHAAERLERRCHGAEAFPF